MLSKIIYALAVLLISLKSQDALRINSNVIEVVSGSTEHLSGILGQPQFSSISIKVFSFTRQIENQKTLYINSVDKNKLYEVSTITRKNQSFDLFTNSAKKIYNDQLDWCPADIDGKNYFAFVGSGDDDNHDIYIGYVGGESYIRVTHEKSIESQPKWSPPGDQLAFISTRDGKGSIYLIPDIHLVINSKKLSPDNLKRVTAASEEEILELEWNPNPESGLIVYTKREKSDLHNQFGLYIVDIFHKSLQTRSLFKENIPGNLSQPVWNPYNDRQLLFCLQEKEALSEETDQSTELHLAEISGWDDEGQLKPAQHITGKSNSVFNNAALNGTRAKWLSGGRALLTRQTQNKGMNPVVTINLDRWLNNKRGNSLEYLDEFYHKFPIITDFDVKENLLLFSAQQGKYYKIFMATLRGGNIIPGQSENFTLDNPNKSSPWSTVFYSTLGTGLGLGLYYILKPPVVPPSKTIPPPPSMPGN